MEGNRLDAVITLVTAFLVLLNTALIAYGNRQRTVQNQGLATKVEHLGEMVTQEHTDAADRSARP